MLEKLFFNIAAALLIAMAASGEAMADSAITVSGYGSDLHAPYGYQDIVYSGVERHVATVDSGWYSVPVGLGYVGEYPALYYGYGLVLIAVGLGLLCVVFRRRAATDMDQSVNGVESPKKLRHMDAASTSVSLSAALLLFVGSSANAYVLTMVNDGVPWRLSGYAVDAYASVNPVEGTDTFYGTPGSTASSSAAYAEFGLQAQAQAGPGAVHVASRAGASSLGFHSGTGAGWDGFFTVKGGDGRVLPLVAEATLTGSYEATTPVTGGFALAEVGWQLRGYGVNEGSAGVYVVRGIPLFYATGAAAESTTTASLRICPKVSISGVNSELPCSTISAAVNSFQGFFDSLRFDLEGSLAAIGYNPDEGDSISFDSTVSWNTKLRVPIETVSSGWMGFSAGTSTLAYIDGNSESNFGSTLKLTGFFAEPEVLEGLSNLSLEFADGSEFSVHPLDFSRPVDEPASSWALGLMALAASRWQRRRKRGVTH
ncbi:MAG: hypothetical protein NOF05_16675 [Candidatus Accumulibacter phosphatis]|uniref:PEP-CTERM protein-sorting domain-containing protein n=1 Tax=Candidatus Thiothrix phosphatis TaxID=3112415 RepID=A0ABU6CXC6_9GAMM|nr:hypothetical protein [Candidatus Thiothrix sp. Deng01]MCQ1550398.1 hypothetical protein [Candidatus Accumulibacter phosphatis]MEB4591410.1 hypothetical protein [Candidatus Thiothrix sp. Deng01]